VHMRASSMAAITGTRMWLSFHGSERFVVNLAPNAGIGDIPKDENRFQRLNSPPAPSGFTICSPGPARSGKGIANSV